MELRLEQVRMSAIGYLLKTATIVILVVMGLHAQYASAATGWPTTNFKVDFGLPTDATTDGQDAPPRLPDPDRRPAPDFNPADPEANSTDETGNQGDRNPGDHSLSFDVLAMFFESSLHEIAVTLEQEGFEPPSLPLHNDGNEVYYKVHIFDLSRRSSTDNLGVYHSGKYCDDPGVSASSWFGVRIDQFVPLTSNAEPFLYMVLAHELFHSVQQSYTATFNALDGCNGETDDYLAVSEGTANGVAFKLSAKRWPKYYLKFAGVSDLKTDEDEEITVWKYNAGSGHIFPYLIGVRPYSLPFLDVSASDPDDRKQAPYETSSFWYNLIDRHDIRIIDHLFRQPLRYGDSPSLLQWLDNGLESYKPEIGGLYLAFSHFVTEYASQAGSRFPWEEFGAIGRDTSVEQVVSDSGGKLVPGSPYTGSEEEVQKGWIEKILGKCQQVRLQAGNTETVPVPVVLDRISAGCIEVTWEGFENNFEIKIEAEHRNLRLLDQLNVGLAYQQSDEGELFCYSKIKPSYHDPLWTCLHEKPFQTNGSEDLRYARMWSTENRFSGSGRRYYTITNVAPQAEKTRPIPKDDPVIIRIGIAEALGNDGREYDVPNSVTTGMGMPGMDKESLYGITKMPAPPGTRLSFSVPVKGKDLGYAAAWMGEPPAIGYTGSYKGMLSGPGDGSMSMISSSLCERHADGIIGQITRFDHDYLWVDLDADLCKLTIPPPPDGRFTKVDHIKVSLRFPLGWRYSGNSPVDIVTPGMQVFIDRHALRVPRVLSGNWQNPGSSPGPGLGPGPGPDSDPDYSDDPSSSQPNPGGTSSSSVICSCGCDEMEDFDKRAEEAKAAGDEDAMMVVQGRMVECLGFCQNDYLICRIDAAEEEKQKKESLREQKLSEIDCDCSCEALDKIFSRSRELQKKFATSGAVSNQEIIQLSQCYSVCQQEVLACAMSK